MIFALNKFVSKSVDRCKPFFQFLKKWKGFQWTEECDKAFKDLKSYLTSTSISSQLDPGEDLYIYLAISDYAMSLVLLKNRDEVQKLVYYLSKTMVDAETRYLPLEKVALALVHAMRKLLHYF